MCEHCYHLLDPTDTCVCTNYYLVCLTWTIMFTVHCACAGSTLQILLDHHQCWKMAIVCELHHYVSTIFPSLAHHQVSPCNQSWQEACCAGAQEHGEVPAVPDPGWNPLPPCQLGAAQRPGQLPPSQSTIQPWLTVTDNIGHMTHD